MNRLRGDMVRVCKNVFITPPFKLRKILNMKKLLIAACLAVVAVSTADAQVRDITVTVENLAPTNSVSFAPLRVGFHSGVFDAFDNGSAASDAIISIAEGGTGDAWFPAFQAADPTAVLGSVVNGGPAVPAGNAGVGNAFNSTATATFRVDTSVNRFFTFANMVVPSNDLFLGNDNPIELFDASGNQLINTIDQTGASIWNAGSEVANIDNAAFIPGSDNDARIEEDGVVEFSFSELDVFNGVTTAAGYEFDSSLISDGTSIYRISLSSTAVPEPSSVALLSMGVIGLFVRRRRS
jgi:hypothetical protein